MPNRNYQIRARLKRLTKVSRSLGDIVKYFARSIPETPMTKAPDLKNVKTRSRETAAILSSSLWAGHAKYSVRKLEALKCIGSPRESATAALALARWYASSGDYNCALDRLRLAKRQIGKNDWGVRHRSVEIAILTALGLSREAKRALEEAVSALGEQPEICLIAANVARLVGGFEANAPDRLSLAWLNKLFYGAGLATLQKGDPCRPLALDNLITSPVPKHPQSGMAKLSVIVPAYNAAETLFITVKSILDQTWDNLEIIIVDDASTDDTWVAIQSLAAADHRVKAVRHTNNRVPHYSRNTGLAHASGEFVTIHDADDWSHPEKFAIQALHLLQGHTTNRTMYARVKPDLSICLNFSNSSIF